MAFKDKLSKLKSRFPADAPPPSDDIFSFKAEEEDAPALTDDDAAETDPLTFKDGEEEEEVSPAASIEDDDLVAELEKRGFTVTPPADAPAEDEGL